ncbi:Hypothetical protein PHPALM_16025 [Phytophthora palmivora]|uniref:Uncharacterized protein n=1 Tax=Phytophthora palmivora TaxID=4796 RepID=A0A2P4XQT2_9STRA|nr:Hypothetical protein PHPALM_16025 [Phytophthora palmivora]
MKTLQQRMKDMEAERDREKESSQNMQRFQAGQLRNLRATLSQVQEARRVGHPDLATATPVLDTEDPEVATKYPVFGSEIRSDESAVRVEPMSHPPALKTASREVATFQQAAPARSTVTKRVKAERNGAAATTTTATQVTRVAPVTEAKGDTRRASTRRGDPPRKSDARRSNGGPEALRREKRRGEAPDPGGDSEDSSSESESSSSDDSEFWQNGEPDSSDASSSWNYTFDVEAVHEFQQSRRSHTQGMRPLAGAIHEYVVSRRVVDQDTHSGTQVEASGICA